MSSIEKFDIRVGLITAIAKHPNADSLYVESIDLAEPAGPRQVLSGLVKHLPEEAMLNQRVLVCCNLKPAKMRGMDSFGMLLCGVQKLKEADEEIVRLVKPPVESKIGERVQIEGFTFDSTAVIDGRKADAQLFEAVFGSGELSTDADGVACFRGIPLMTSAGPATCELKDSRIQ
jgi:methionine--tRNA ligase beta chain